MKTKTKNQNPHCQWFGKGSQQGEVSENLPQEKRSIGHLQMELASSGSAPQIHYISDFQTFSAHCTG